MKKHVIIIFILLCSMSLCAQIRNSGDIPTGILSKLDSMGIDSNPVLNRCESEYFNAVFEDSRGDFDFTDKKVGFITGSNGRMLSNKKKYFNSLRRMNSPVGGASLYIFDAAQKKGSGGYDVAIVSWSMVLRSANDAMKILNGQNNVRKFRKR